MRGGKRQGAGRKPRSDNRAVHRPVRWTAGEEAEIEAAAKKAGKSPTDFVRETALERARAN